MALISMSYYSTSLIVQIALHQIQTESVIHYCYQFVGGNFTSSAVNDHLIITPTVTNFTSVQSHI